MRVVKVRAKRGLYGDVSVCRTIGNFGISVFHGPGRSYRPEASSLNRISQLCIRTAGFSTERTALRCDRVQAQ
jgi:hypothetical protein